MATSISSGFIFDRAAVVTTALLQTILSSSTPQAGLRQHVEALLRDEFADIQRQIISENDYA